MLSTLLIRLFLLLVQPFFLSLVEVQMLLIKVSLLLYGKLSLTLLVRKLAGDGLHLRISIELFLSLLPHLRLLIFQLFLLLVFEVEGFVEP